MRTCPHKGQKISHCERCRTRIDQRMDVDHIEIEQLFFNNESNRTGGFVDKRLWRDRSRQNAQMLQQVLGAREGKPPFRADRLVEGLEIEG